MIDVLMDEKFLKYWRGLFITNRDTSKSELDNSQARRSSVKDAVHIGIYLNVTLLVTQLVVIFAMVYTLL